MVQDEASQLVALLAGAHPGRRVLDTCASPGGKTTAHRGGAGRGRPRRRVRRPRSPDRACSAERLQTTGATNVLLVQADLLAPLPFRAGSTP